MKDVLVCGELIYSNCFKLVSLFIHHVFNTLVISFYIYYL